jgi:glycerol kinase
MNRCLLALDQGTTTSCAILLGRDGRIVSSAQQEFEQLFPAPGHVEHDPEAIWSSQLDVARRVGRLPAGSPALKPARRTAALAPRGMETAEQRSPAPGGQ